MFHQEERKRWEQPIDAVLVVTHSPQQVMLKDGMSVLPGPGANTTALQRVW